MKKQLLLAFLALGLIASTPVRAAPINNVSLNEMEDLAALEEAFCQFQPAQYRALDWTTVYSMQLVNSQLLRHTLPFDLCVPCDKPCYGVWFDGIGAFAQQQQMGQLPAFHTRAGGFLVGLDYRLSPELVAGMLGGISSTHLDWQDNLGKSNFISAYGGIYLDYSRGCWYADTSLIYSNQAYHVNRTVEFNAIERGAKSNTRGNALLYHIELGMNYHLCGFSLVPFVAGDYIYLHRTGQNEQGAHSLNLQVESCHANFAMAEAGVACDYRFKTSCGFLIPSVQVSWLYTAPVSNNELTVNLVDSEETFTISTTKKSINQVVPEAALAYQVSEYWYLAIAYRGAFGTSRQEQDVRLSLELQY